MNKMILRKEMIGRRSEIPEELKEKYSAGICRELQCRFLPTTVCSFVSFRGEPDLEGYHKYLLETGIPLLLPRVEGDVMEFYHVTDLCHLQKSSMGIWEPDPDFCKKWSYEEIWESKPLILTPGVAFTREGARMGYGGGYYDRFFSSSNGRGYKIGIAFKIQLLDNLPLESHDFFVDDVLFFPKTVVLGLSGGVDSAVAAHLLTEQGYEVLGAFLNMWKEGKDDEDARDALLVAERLDITFLFRDYTEEFKESVVSYFVREYMEGRTPNPCTYCNREMKIKKLIKIAEENGAESVATGHYVKIRHNVATGRMEIHSPKDVRKDQGYMLSRLSQDQLSRLLTPLSELEKEEVRRLAVDAGLPVSRKKDSQEICFVEGSYVDVLERLGAHGKSGRLILDGAVVGSHSGIEKFTIGQRKGLGSFGKPVFVVRIDSHKGDVVLGEQAELFSKTVCFSAVNGVAVSSVQGTCTAKIRYASSGARCVVSEGVAYFEEPQRAVTPGQVIVFYRDDTILASGVIDSAQT